MTRLAVFVDYQNLYHGARGAFGEAHEAPGYGHVRPLALGVLLRQLGEAVDSERELAQVRIYRGEPTAHSHPKLQAAYQRQVEAWRRHDMVEVITRPLRHSPTAWDSDGRPSSWDTGREKGIDVLIALDMVLGAVRDEYDVAVLFSGDTDLVPAIDGVIEAGKRVENAVWWPDRGPGFPLRTSGSGRIWVHRLGRRRFEAIRDQADYGQPLAGQSHEQPREE